MGRALLIFLTLNLLTAVDLQAGFFSNFGKSCGREESFFSMRSNINNIAFYANKFLTNRNRPKNQICYVALGPLQGSVVGLKADFGISAGQFSKSEAKVFADFFANHPLEHIRDYCFDRGTSETDIASDVGRMRDDLDAIYSIVK